MKNILESKESFEAYVTIDICYYMLSDLLKNLFKSRTPIVMMIKDTIDLLEQIVKAKKVIGADYSSVTKTLMQIKDIEQSKVL